MTTFKRRVLKVCRAEGCRTLSRQWYCEQHRDQPPPAGELAISAQAVRDEQHDDERKEGKD